jgi:hypothetical protein
MSNLTYPNTSSNENKTEQQETYRGPSLPKILAEVKELTQELFLHPAEKPLFNAPVYRG